jgi:hypothetical protein
MSCLYADILQGENLKNNETNNNNSKKIKNKKEINEAHELALFTKRKNDDFRV